MSLLQQWSLSHVSEVLSLHKSQYDLFAVGFFGVMLRFHFLRAPKKVFCAILHAQRGVKLPTLWYLVPLMLVAFHVFGGALQNIAEEATLEILWLPVALPSLYHLSKTSFPQQNFNACMNFTWDVRFSGFFFFCIRQKESFLFHPYRRKFASRLAGKIFGMLHRKSKELMEVRRVHFEILQDILQKALNQPLKLSSWSSSY